jgi:hypothetical protein
VRLRDVVDELEHVDGLAHARAAEEADLAALRERADQVDDLDAGLEELGRRRQLVELRRGLVDPRRASAFTGPRSSIGRPSTSITRPSTPWPTGTWMFSPVARTFMPRFRPSELPIAIVRTMPSPSCCSTSKVSPCSTSVFVASCSRTSAS